MGTLVFAHDPVEAGTSLGHEVRLIRTGRRAAGKICSPLLTWLLRGERGMAMQRT